MLDLVIIGSGPAGLTAAIYASRAGLNFTLLDRDGYGGGQITSAHLVQNYPGVQECSGFDLGDLFIQQAAALGAEVQLALVAGVEQTEGGYLVHTDDGESLHTRAIIVATGASPRALDIPGEKEHVGKGVSYCATCDGAFYRGKSVAVVGGGDTAVEDGIYLASLCTSVTLLLRRDQFRAAQRRVELLKSLPNVTVRTCVRPVAFGDGTITLDNGSGTEVLTVDGVFVAVGSQPAVGFLQNLPLEQENRYICADESCRTNLPGLFVAGDIRTKQLRQVITAAADGANAVTSVLEYLHS